MKKKIIFIITLMFVLVPFVNVYATTKVTCGNVSGIPEKIPEITRFIVTLIEIAVPIILVIFGSLDLFKGITSQKEDDIKKGQQMLIKRLILGAIIFFTIVIVKFIISLVADASSKNIINCVDCFLSDKSSCTVEN